MPTVLRPPDPGEEYRRLLDTQFPDIIDIWNKYAPHHGNDLLKIDMVGYLTHHITKVTSYDTSFGVEYDVKILAFPTIANRYPLSYRYTLVATGSDAAGNPLGALKLKDAYVTDEAAGSIPYLEDAGVYDAGIHPAKKVVDDLDYLKIDLDDLKIKEIMESESGEIATKVLKSMRDAFAGTFAGVSMMSGRDAEMAEYSKKGVHSVRTSRTAGSYGHASRRPRGTMPCEVRIDDSTYRIICDCWADGKIWCAAANVYASSKKLINEYGRICRSSTKSVTTLIPWTCGYFGLKVTMDASPDGSEVLVKDFFDPHVQIALYPDNGDTLETAMSMFREYYESSLDFTDVAQFCQSAFRQDVSLVTSRKDMPCKSSRHRWVASANTIKRATGENNFLFVGLPQIVLAEAYSLANWGVCTTCNAENFDFSADLPPDR